MVSVLCTDFDPSHYRSIEKVYAVLLSKPGLRKIHTLGGRIHVDRKAREKSEIILHYCHLGLDSCISGSVC